MDEAPKIPEQLQAKISAMPESSYGVNLVTVVLDDGTEIRHVHVAWGVEIVRVGDSTKVPFDPIRIVDVRSETLVRP